VKNFLSHRDLERLDEATKTENWQLLNLDQNITVQESDKIASNGGGKPNLWGRIKAKLGYQQK